MIRLLCTDLDRTLLPNGPETEPAGARERLAERLRRYALPLAFVTGRDEGRVREAIATWSLPMPAFVLADAGTSFFVTDGERWTLDADWRERQRRAWGGHDGTRVHAAIDDIEALRAQPDDRQQPFKRSYTLPAETDVEALVDEIDARLAPLGIEATSLSSHDPLTDEGLLDVVTPMATKAGAVAELAARLSLTREQVLFAGDSGNDLDALAAGFSAVLVGNADDTTRRLARERARAAGADARLYEARAPFAAGILEGLEHYRAVYSGHA